MDPGYIKKGLRSQEWVSKESQLCFCFLSNISQLFLLEPLQCSSRYISPSTIREKYVIGRPYNKVAWTFYCENRRGGRLYKRSPVFYVLFSVIESTLRKKGPNCCYFITLLEQTCDVTETPVFICGMSMSDGYLQTFHNKRRFLKVSSEMHVEEKRFFYLSDFFRGRASMSAADK